MTQRIVAVAFLVSMMTGCVGTDTHKRVVAELEGTREANLAQQRDFEKLQVQTAAALEAMEREQDRLGKALIAETRLREAAESELASARYHLSNQQQSRRDAEDKIEDLAARSSETSRRNMEMREQLELLRSESQRERDKMRVEVQELTSQLASTRQALGDARDRVAGLEGESRRLSDEMLIARTELAKAQRALTTTEQQLRSEQDTRARLETQFTSLRSEHDKLTAAHSKLREERDVVQNRMDDLQRRLENAQQDLAGTRQALTDALARLTTAEQEKEEVVMALSGAREDTQMLKSSLSAERAKVVELQRDKQRLLSGTTTAQEEIARLQRRSGELETQAVRADELALQLAARDREIGKLRQAVADREALAAEVTARTDALAATKARVDTLTGELAGVSSESARIRQERDELAARAMTLTRDLEESEAHISRLTGTVDGLQQEMTRLRQDRDDLIARLRNQEEKLHGAEVAVEIAREENGHLRSDLDYQARRLDAAQRELSRVEREYAAKEARLELLTQSKMELSEELNQERARLAQERATKQEEMRRLTETQQELSHALRKEIETGEIRIQQVRDRLTINMVDRVLFHSGRAVIKPAGLEVLQRVSEILREIKDKQIRIEGHTDAVPIGPRIIDRFPTNWELSTARATSVVRYLIDQGKVDEANLSAVGYAYNRPVANNETPEGRAQNRRIEIVLYPRDLGDVSGL